MYKRGVILQKHIEKHIDFWEDNKKSKITLAQLLSYIALFVFPLVTLFMVSLVISKFLAPILHSSVINLSMIMTSLGSFFIFLFIIPYIRKKENITSVRYSMIGFAIVCISVSIPRMIKGDFNLFFSMFIILGNYVLLTFTYCPEILGMNFNIIKWFKEYKQITIVLIYFIITFSYVLGFGWTYYQIYSDPVNQPAFNIKEGINPNLLTFCYYSLVLYATIGFGDITPIVPIAQLLVMIQGFIGMLVNVIFISILLLYISNFLSFIKMEKRIEHDEKVIEKEEEELLKIEKARARSKRKPKRKR